MAEPAHRETARRILCALDQIEPPIVRRNKMRTGDQWEVVLDLDPQGPITETTYQVMGVYASHAEATAVAAGRYQADRELAVDKVLGIDAEAPGSAHSRNEVPSGPPIR